MGRRMVGGKYLVYINCDIDEKIHDERVFCLKHCFLNGWISQVVDSICRPG
jgi:hypothetical protein